MSEATMLALDEKLDQCLRAEARGDAMPLALRRFGERWEVPNPTLAARLAATDILETYSKRFPSGNSFVSVSRLCDIVGARLSPSRSATAYLSAGSSGKHLGHSGMVRFSVNGEPQIQIPAGVADHRARVAVAHELGHVLIHKRANGYDDVTIRLPASEHEEAVAEYAARMLLLSGEQSEPVNLAQTAVQSANRARVTVHAAACRLGDPDVRRGLIRGAILWKLSSSVPPDSPIAERLTPAWRLCPSAFIPIGKCKARNGSLIAELGSSSEVIGAIHVEDVKIGSLQGLFRVHAFAWGSILGGTRLVLSIFELATPESAKSDRTLEEQKKESARQNTAQFNLCPS